jgi:hypothetical protein
MFILGMLHTYGPPCEVRAVRGRHSGVFPGRRGPTGATDVFVEGDAGSPAGSKISRPGVAEPYNAGINSSVYICQVG